jgi:hypothetical protein
MKPVIRLFFPFCFFLLLAVSLQAQTGTIRGKVIDRNGEPLEKAAVLIPELKRGAFTNDEGLYSLDRLPEGTFQVFATYAGYDTLFKTITLSRAQKITEKFVLEERGFFAEEVTITARETGKIETKEVGLGQVEFSAQEINLLPSIGSPDLMQYLQVLPGIVFTGDQGGQLYIRGGTPIQNMSMMDGMIVYSPFHSIGLFSTFDPDYIRSVNVYSAGFPAQYGGRVSSVIDIKTRNGNFNNLSGKLNINPFMSSILVEGPIKRGRRSGGGSSFLASYRRNYIDQTSQLVYPYVNDTLGLPFNFTDFYGKLTFSDGANYANIFGFRNTDNVNYGLAAADIGWEANGAGANFMLLPQGAGAIIRGNFAWSNYNVGLNTASEDFPRESAIQGFNGGLDVSYIVNTVDEFSAGLIFLGFETDYVFTNSLGFRTSSSANNSEFAGYMNYKKLIQSRSFPTASKDSLWDLMVIEPSLRLHYFNDQSHVAFEPRLRWKLNLPRVSFSAATGWYTQNLMSAASDRDVVNFFQGILSAPSSLANRLKPHNLQTAFHFLGGVEMELFPNLSTTIEGWFKDFTQLTNINRNKLFPGDPDFITETGLAYGADLVLKYQTPELYLYGTYGWSKVTRTEVQGRTYAPVFDRRHTVNVVGSYRLKPFDYIVDEDGRKRMPKFRDFGWEFGFRWTLGSGFPFTQTQGYFEKLDFFENGAQTDLATQNGQLGLILADELNGGRLPYYHRMDLSAKRRWLIKNAWLLELNFSLVNTYDRQNIFYFDRVRFTPIYQLPILPSLGLTLKY